METSFFPHCVSYLMGQKENCVIDLHWSFCSNPYSRTTESLNFSIKEPVGTLSFEENVATIFEILDFDTWVGIEIVRIAQRNLFLMTNLDNQYSISKYLMFQNFPTMSQRATLRMYTTIRPCKNRILELVLEWDLWWTQKCRKHLLILICLSTFEIVFSRIY